MTEMAISIDSSQKMTVSAAVYTTFISALFGANTVAIKIGLLGMGPFTSAAIRFTLASIALFVWAKATRQSLSFTKNQFRPLLIISAIFTVQLSLFHLGMSKTNASRGALLANIQPFFLLFLAHQFIPGDRITKKKFFGLLLGFLGVAFVFMEKTGVSSGFQTGDVIILGAAFLWACNGAYTKRILSDVDPYHLVIYPMIVSVPFFFMEAFLWDGSMVTRIDASVSGALIYQSLICAAFGFVAWTNLLKRYGAVSLHSFIFIMPISGVFLGGLLLREPITVKLIMALVLIALGIAIVQIRERTAGPILSPGENL
jgi:drug/metabolite transporter (DMT)-like permease